MKIIKILTFVFVALSFASCGKGNGVFGTTPVATPNSSPNGEWMYMHDITGNINAAFSVNTPAQYYVYFPTDRPCPEADDNGCIVVNVWPLNANLFGLAINSIDGNPWPAFNVRFTDDAAGLAALQGMKDAYFAAKDAHAGYAFYNGYVNPFKDGTDSPQTVKLRGNGMWWPVLWPH